MTRRRWRVDLRRQRETVDRLGTVTQEIGDTQFRGDTDHLRHLVARQHLVERHGRRALAVGVEIWVRRHVDHLHWERGRTVDTRKREPTPPSLYSAFRMRTTPSSPSTSSIWPSRMMAVAEPVPTTAGMPYSRATMAQWLRMPPESVTMAATVAKSGVQGVAVVSATSTSPRRSLPASSNDRSTLAGPRTRPDEPGCPVTTSR